MMQKRTINSKRMKDFSSALQAAERSKGTIQNYLRHVQCNSLLDPRRIILRHPRLNNLGIAHRSSLLSCLLNDLHDRLHCI